MLKSKNRYVPSNFVKREKKSVFDKILYKKNKRLNNGQIFNDSRGSGQSPYTGQYNKILNEDTEKYFKAIVKHKYSAKKY